jgi:trimeric autotransporter adhesin
MKNRKIFAMNLLAVACLVFSPAAEARRPSEDRGNGNSAAENVDALNLSTTGSNNTAHGWFSLSSNTTGSSNTADGFQALFSNTTGEKNTAIGLQALVTNTTGSFNTATGANTLSNNTTGDSNTATGILALAFNTTGSANTATGVSALALNTIGSENTAIGFHALFNNTTGSFNTVIGDAALVNSTTGSSNTVLGQGAGSNLNTGDGNVYIGSFVPAAAGDESNTTRIRNIGLTAIVGGLQVAMEAFGPNGDGKLGVAVSSRRYKEDIKPMDKASERLFALKPVTFRAKGNMGPGNVKHYGLIAEDVAAVDPDLVVYNPDGKPETLRSDSISAMLLNEFLKEHRNVEKLKDHLQATVARQQKEIEALTAQLNEQATQIQKVSVQLQMTKPAPQVACLPVAATATAGRRRQ